MFSLHLSPRHLLRQPRPLLKLRAGVLSALLLLFAQAPADAAPFKHSWTEPYLSSGPAARAKRFLLTGRPERAEPLLRNHLNSKGSRERNQARFLLAHALLRSKKYDAAERLFRGLEQSYPTLKHYHRINSAEAMYRNKKYTRAARRAASVPESSVLYRRALLLRARALFAAGKTDGSIPLLRSYLSKGGSRGRSHTMEARMLLAKSLAKGPSGRKKSNKAQLMEAAQQLKQVIVDGVLSAHRAEASKLLTQICARLPRGREILKLSTRELYRQAMALDRAMRNKRTEAALARLLRLKGLGLKLRCQASYHLARAVFKQRDRARAEPLYVRAAALCGKAGIKDLMVKSLYNGARGLWRKGNATAALARYAEIEKRHVGHSYADDARLRAAEIHQDLGQEKEAAQLLSSIPGRYPAGDMVREALWRLARQAYFAGKLDLASKHLDRIITGLGRAKIYYAHGRALYWKARILATQKKGSQARDLYERCIREYPLSYYALLSFNRLRETDPHTFTALGRELLEPAGKTPKRWSIPPNALFARRGFLRGVELARLGFGKAAAKELRGIGIEARRGQSRDDLWLAALLYDGAGLWHLSHQVPRKMDKAYRWSYPGGANHRRWLISYPAAFLPEVKKNAARAGVLPWLVLAVMREESGFVPTIESYANAVGLMQLILPTARTAARQHKLEVHRKALHDPAVNIKLGATYLGFLMEAFGHTFPLAISGYNAGEGATYRWLKRFKKLPLDELMERIPYDQTRRYSKRVLSSLFTYALLHGDSDERVPVIPYKLPAVTMKSFKAARKKIRGTTKKVKKKKK